ncbi:MAG: VanZ family protein [Candidatus Pelethousia sp.]|nr:VanZ family protein [Candidatus Pelethousia sp.]
MGNRKLTKILFAVYLAALTWIIVCKMSFSLYQDYARSINLIPFGASAVVNQGLDVSEILLNVLAFLPFGIYAGLLFPDWSFGKRILLFAGTSAAYEAMQYALAIGRSDITDLISNCLGGALGLLLFAWIAKLCKTEPRTAKCINICALAGTLCAGGFIALLLAANA